MELSFTVSRTLILQAGQETDKEMEGALDDVAKQLDKQALEEKEKDDDDEGKCNLFFLLTLQVSVFLDSHFNKPFTDVFWVWLCFFSWQSWDATIYTFYLFWQQFRCHNACI